MSNYCEKCNHTGLLPIIRNGRVVPNCFSICECRRKLEEEDTYRPPPKPEDFDFPMSDSFRAFTYEYCGRPDPGYVPPQRDTEVTPVYADMAWTKRQWDKVQQLEGKINHLENKVIESMKAKRPQGEY